MDRDTLRYEIKESYTLIQPKSLGPDELDRLPSQVEDLLLQKKQDVVLSLRHIDAVFSAHLTAIVQIYRLMQSFNLRLIVTDVSPAVLNVMQITQLDSLLPIYLSLQDFEERLAQASAAGSQSKNLQFSYEILSQPDFVTIVCRGYMSFGPQARELQNAVFGCGRIRFDLSEVGYMDTRMLILMADLAARARVEIAGASNVLRELFEQHRIQHKVIFLD